jgi:UDPglucose 6-dehydrogenase
LAAGTAINDLLTADRVLIGSSPTPAGRRAAATLASVYAAWIPQSRIVTTNVFSSELAKLVANSMLAQRVSSINSIAAICEATGADVDEVAAAVGADVRIGSRFLRAGIGFGGSCFRKDVLSLVYLAETLGLPEVAAFWRGVITMNEYSRDRFSARVVKRLNNTLRGKKIVLLGYAFKKDTNDTRESPALEIIRSLLEEGPREVAVFDPCCIPAATEEEVSRLLGPGRPGGAVLKRDGGPVHVYSNAYEACNASDAIIIATEFDEFKSSNPPGALISTGATAAAASAAVAASPVRSPPPPERVDPRPFERLEPSESDLLALHKFLVRSASPDAARIALNGSVAVAQTEAGIVTDPSDPLGRFNPVPSCADDCPDCILEKTAGPNTSAYGASGEHRPKGRLDWAKISYHMRKPKWIFDGRGVLNVREMEKLGFRVETVGRQPGGR